MWDDKHDWYSVWLEPGQTLLLTLSHASGDGVSMSVWMKIIPLGIKQSQKLEILFSSERMRLKLVEFTVSQSMQQ